MSFRHLNYELFFDIHAWDSKKEKMNNQMEEIHNQMEEIREHNFYFENIVVYLIDGIHNTKYRLCISFFVMLLRLVKTFLRLCYHFFQALFH
ncbi:unnamed protein product [Nesidiocoris tenuis]|uniref:Uncharacterized protein n=1 Tax=Nesidiocoris tenuis TaxID=355587 RepID=A0A6H5H9Q1_9HEMI|nr:unnamed protein product [Nesidiocoris tenuis]